MSEFSQFPAFLRLSDFGYDLPDEKIARYPLADRESAKLLVWKNGHIREGLFSSLGDFLSSSSLLVMNNSRVVEARILFSKKSGGQIEIFCMEPFPSQNLTQALAQTGVVRWKCLIGGASKWKNGQVLEKIIGETKLLARFIEKRSNDFIVEFSWDPSDLSFAAVLHHWGSIPLPPYLKRQAESTDTLRYQTVYAQESGSVAAPTAGLHFSEKLIRSLSEKGIDPLYLTLHVGAGTFLPVKTENISEHHMHEEFIEVTDILLERLLSLTYKSVIAVGTTSLRTLETLYWLGMMVSKDKNIREADLRLDQWYPYSSSPLLKTEDALNCLLERIRRLPGKKLVTKTQLFIVPGYQFKIVRGLITNFHQPHSTLLLLVAAFAGSSWKRAYSWALDNNYRFLSYGDGCLFFPEL
jgi:S-adenosylmethionine:tRNA ribosyltransferase-isomerase